MKFKGLIISLTIIFGLVLGSNGTAAMEQNQELGDGEWDLKEVIESEKTFREVSGLETSEEHIKKVIFDENNKLTKEKYGAFLTPQEVKQVEKILKIDEFIPDLRKIIDETEEKSSELASFTADFKNNKIYIYLKEGDYRTINLRDKVISSFPYPEMLDFQYVKYSNYELDKVASEIEIGSYIKDSQIVSIGTEIKRNQVVVGINPYSEEVKEFFKSKYGDMVHVEKDDYEIVEARTTPLTYMQGGLQIGSTADRSLNRGFCTLGYTAKKNGEDYIVTAGHCLANAKHRNEPNWYQGGQLIGAGAAYGENYDYDAGLIKLTSSKTATNYIYKYTSFDSKYTRETNGFAYEGQPVCISGAKSGFQCGEVSHPGKQIMVTNETLGITYPAFRTLKTYKSDGGDSGAPVWYGGVLIGVHSTGNSFTHLNTFKTRLGITAIVNY